MKEKEQKITTEYIYWYVFGRVPICSEGVEGVRWGERVSVVHDATSTTPVVLLHITEVLYRVMDRLSSGYGNQ